MIQAHASEISSLDSCCPMVILNLSQFSQVREVHPHALPGSGFVCPMSEISHFS